MEMPSKTKAKVSSLARIILNEENGKQLDSWIEQLKGSCPGIRIKKQDLVSWLIVEKGNCLSQGDLKTIRERFFDAVELAQWALEQLRAAKQRNEKLTLADLIRNGKTTSSDSHSKKKTKVPPKSEMEVPRNEAPSSSGFGTMD